MQATKQLVIPWTKLKTRRVYEEDPKLRLLEERRSYLEGVAEMLNMSNSQPSIIQRQNDLTLGLPKNHVWESAG